MTIQTKMVISSTDKKMKLRGLFLILVSGLLCTSCHINGGKNKHTHTNEEKISILRYDKVQSEYIKSNSFSALQKMNMEYQMPTKILIEEILEIGQVGDDTITQKLKNYYSDSTLIQLINDVEHHFTNLEAIENELTDAFIEMHQQLPSIKIPKVYTQVSAFNESVILSDSLIGISLDKYLGEDYPFYKRFYHPYQRRTMVEGRIVPDCILSIIVAQDPFLLSEEISLLDIMIYMGKCYYIAMNLLDYTTAGQVLAYSTEAQEWCVANEGYIWNEILARNLLATNNMDIICSMMEPQQNTGVISKSAPPMLGTWLGIQIIDAYMKKNKEVTMEQLLNDNNYIDILKKSNYTPHTK